MRVPAMNGVPLLRTAMEPIFEADLESCAYGYRPKRSAKDAIQEVHQHLRQGYTDVVDADLSQYFDSIPQSDGCSVWHGGRCDAASDQDVAFGTGRRTGREGESEDDGKSGEGHTTRWIDQSFAWRTCT